MRPVNLAEILSASFLARCKARRDSHPTHASAEVQHPHEENHYRSMTFVPTPASRQLSSLPSHFSEQIGLMLMNQRFNHGRQFALNDFIQLVKCQVNAVIGHPALGIVVGANSL